MCLQLSPFHFKFINSKNFEEQKQKNGDLVDPREFAFDVHPIDQGRFDAICMDKGAESLSIDEAQITNEVLGKEDKRLNPPPAIVLRVRNKTFWLKPEMTRSASPLLLLQQPQETRTGLFKCHTPRHHQQQRCTSPLKPKTITPFL